MKRTEEERRVLHASAAKKHRLDKAIAEAATEYKKAVAQGELRRTPAGRRNSRTG